MASVVPTSYLDYAGLYASYDDGLDARAKANEIRRDPMVFPYFFIELSLHSLIDFDNNSGSFRESAWHKGFCRDQRHT